MPRRRLRSGSGRNSKVLGLYGPVSLAIALTQLFQRNAELRAFLIEVAPIEVAMPDWIGQLYSLNMILAWIRIKEHFMNQGK